MKQFEYLRQHIPNDLTLARLGFEGWELITVANNDFIFKREIIKPKTEKPFALTKDRPKKKDSTND